MAQGRHSRKQIYVSHAIQGRLLVRLGAYFVVYHFLLWHILFVTNEWPFAARVPFVDRYAAFFAQHALLLVFMAAVLPILLWDMVKFTHRVAGPFVRFERALKQMARGEIIEPISLRKGDLVDEFRDVFNEFIVARNRELSSAAKQSSGGGRSEDAADTEPCAASAAPDRSYAHS